MNLPSFSEMFDEIDRAKSKEAKIAVLHKHSGKNLKTFLGYVFDPNIKWLIPTGTPPYTKSEDDPNVLRGRIWQDFRLLQHFNSTGPYPNMKPAKREELFISFLQSVDPEDAKLLCFVKDNRKFPQKSVTRALIKQAFPLLESKWGPETEVPKAEPVTVKAVIAPLEGSSLGSLTGFGNFDDVNENSVVEIIPSEELKEELKRENAKPKPVKGNTASTKKTGPAIKTTKPKRTAKTA